MNKTRNSPTQLHVINETTTATSTAYPFIYIHLTSIEMCIRDALDFYILCCAFFIVNFILFSLLPCHALAFVQYILLCAHTHTRTKTQTQTITTTEVHQRIQITAIKLNNKIMAIIYVLLCSRLFFSHISSCGLHFSHKKNPSKNESMSVNERVCVNLYVLKFNM